MLEKKVGGLEEAEKGITNIREAAKWLLTAFAAVGAVLIAGTQLSNIGSLDSWRALIAGLALLIAFSGVAAAIWLTTTIITPHSLALKTVKDPELREVRILLQDRLGLIKTEQDITELERSTLVIWSGGRKNGQSILPI
jgi:hypothetical protein